MIKLPFMAFDLPEWEQRELQWIAQAKEQFNKIGEGAGTGSDAFQEACDRLLEHARRGRQEQLLESITRPLDVRAFTSLLASSKIFAASTVLSQILLKRLESVKTPLSKLSLMQLISAFCMHFDTLKCEGNLNQLCKFIKNQLSGFDTQSATSDLARYAIHANTLFAIDTPVKIMAFAKHKKLDLKPALDELGLKGFNGGRLVTLCQYHYYLETLKSIPVGSNDPVLLEVAKADVANAPYSETKQLGHAILEILIDRSEGQKLSQDWQKIILNIAGDPRVPRSSKKYQQWWVLLGDRRIVLMRGWLSRFDLSLFLDVLEQSARDSHDNAMERMFKPRKAFLEGLLAHNVVIESRLFLTETAERYLVKNYSKDDLPSFATVKGGHASVIYLRLSNDIHLIEGTHSFSIRLMNKLPSKRPLNDYSFHVFHCRKLGVGMKESYLNEFNSYVGLLEKTHDQHFRWQYDVISYLQKSGLNIDFRKLISKKDHRPYKEKFGAD